jgi:integrase
MTCAIPRSRWRSVKARPKALQERMGHSSVTVTLDRYGHLYDGLDAHIADGLDDLLRHSRGLSAASAPFEDHRDDLSNDNDAGHE